MTRVLLSTWDDSHYIGREFRGGDAFLAALYQSGVLGLKALHGGIFHVQNINVHTSKY